MHLQRLVQLTVTLPVLLLLSFLSIAAFFYLDAMMTENAHEKGLLVVEMVRTSMLSNVSKERHSLNSSAMMQQFRTLPGLLEVRMVRGDAVSAQFGPSHSNSAPGESVERDMLQSGRTKQDIEKIGDREVLHFNGPLLAGNSEGSNCLQCHQVPLGTVLGGLSVQVDLTDELREARMVPLIAFGFIAFCGLLIAYALYRFSTPISSTARQIASAMKHGEQGDFSHRLLGIRTDNDETRKIVDSTNAFFAALQQHIGGIADEIELITGHPPGEDNHNTISRARQAVSLMLYAARLKQGLEGDRDLDEAMLRLSSALQRDFGLDKFGIFESPDGSSRLVPAVMVGLPEDWDAWCDQPMGEDISACRATRTSQAVEVIRNNHACLDVCVDCKNTQALRHYCLPINDSGSTRSLITIVYSDEQAEAMQNVFTRLRYVIQVISPELRSKRLLKILKKNSINDPLTGLFNRRFLDEISKGLVSAIKRRKTSLGVLMCDIDFFKQVNDTYGHETGDTVLKSVAKIFQKEMRESDYVIRFGGEEFLILLMDASRDKSAEIAARIRRKVSEKSFNSPQGEFFKTLSIGVAVYPNDSPTLTEAIQQADAALYQAKETGRNRVVISEHAELNDAPNEPITRPALILKTNR